MYYNNKQWHMLFQDHEETESVSKMQVSDLSNNIKLVFSPLGAIKSLDPNKASQNIFNHNTFSISGALNRIKTD